MEDEDQELLVTVTSFEHHDGSVVIFGGELDGKPVRFAADARPARDIAEALEQGEQPLANVPPWAFI